MLKYTKKATIYKFSGILQIESQKTQFLLGELSYRNKSTFLQHHILLELDL